MKYHQKYHELIIAQILGALTAIGLCGVIRLVDLLNAKGRHLVLMSSWECPNFKNSRPIILFFSCNLATPFSPFTN